MPLRAGPDHSASIPSQPSTLLPCLFEHVDEEQPLTVLHIGSAVAETVDFFSRYRCKLHFIDLFEELPELLRADDNAPSLRQRFLDLMHFPPATRFDLCLFWDLFNFLDPGAIEALLATLQPHLHSNSLGHAFAVHNLKTPQSGKLYGISEADRISVRPRPAALPGYSPYNQGQLEKVLVRFKVTRSVLLPHSRLELLLGAAPGT